MRSEIDNDKKALMIDNLLRYKKSNKHYRLAEALFKFNKNRKIRRIIFSLNQRILNTVIGKYMHSF